MAIIDKKGRIRGSVATYVHRQWRDINVIQSKPKKVKQVPASREASFEFGLSSTCARVIRQAFEWTYQGYDGAMVNRLTTAVRNGVSASAKARGDRDIHDADLSFLKGLQFNNNSPLHKVLKTRPVAEMDENNRIIVKLPAIKPSDINSPRASEYIIRLMVIAFDFRRKAYTYTGTRDIKISGSEAFEGGEVVFDEPLAEGRLVALSMSIHGYVRAYGGGMETINSREWSPSEILNVWQLPRTDSAGTWYNVQLNSESGDSRISCSDEEMFKKILWLREKTAKTQKKTPLVQKKSPPQNTGPDIPQGEVRF